MEQQSCFFGRSLARHVLTGTTRRHDQQQTIYRKVIDQSFSSVGLEFLAFTKNGTQTKIMIGFHGQQTVRTSFFLVSCLLLVRAEISLISSVGNVTDECGKDLVLRTSEKE